MSAEAETAANLGIYVETANQTAHFCGLVAQNFRDLYGVRCQYIKK